MYGATLEKIGMGKRAKPMLLMEQMIIQSESNLLVTGNQARTYSLWFKSYLGDETYQVLMSHGASSQMSLFDIIFRTDHVTIHNFGTGGSFNGDTYDRQMGHM